MHTSKAQSLSASRFRGREGPTTPRTDTRLPPSTKGLCSQRDGHTFSTPPPGRTRTGRQAGSAPLAESGCPGLAGGSWVEAAGRSSSARVERTVSHPAGRVPPWAQEAGGWRPWERGGPANGLLPPSLPFRPRPCRRPLAS